MDLRIVSTTRLNRELAHRCRADVFHFLVPLLDYVVTSLFTSLVTRLMPSFDLDLAF